MDTKDLEKIKELTDEYLQGGVSIFKDWYRYDEDFVYRIMPKHGVGIFSKN